MDRKSLGDSWSSVNPGHPSADPRSLCKTWQDQLYEDFTWFKTLETRHEDFMPDSYKDCYLIVLKLETLQVMWQHSQNQTLSCPGILLLKLM